MKIPDNVLQNRRFWFDSNLNERKTPNLRDALASWTRVLVQELKGEHGIPFFFQLSQTYFNTDVHVACYITSAMIHWFIYFPLIHRALYCFPRNTPRRSTVNLKKSCMPNVCSNTTKPVINHVSLLKCISGSMQYKFSARMNQISIGL